MASNENKWKMTRRKASNHIAFGSSQTFKEGTKVIQFWGMRRNFHKTNSTNSLFNILRFYKQV